MYTKPLTFRYRFVFQDHLENFEIIIDPRNIELLEEAPGPYPYWVDLDFHQCPNCPFNSVETAHCPLSINIFWIASRFAHVISYNEIHLDVFTPERIVSKNTTVQRALSSLFGLVIAASNCPHTRFFKPMARFHLPLSTEEETVYRMASMYMLAQYFRKKKGHDPDFEMEKLKTICEQIEIVNASISKRLRAASQTDSAVNAMILLDVFAKALPWAIEASLQDIAALFGPYL